MTDQRRTYLFALVDGGGSVPPEVGAVRRLVERSHRVVVLAEDSMADDVHATGATYRPWVEAPNRPSRHPDDDPYRDWECKNTMQLFQRLLDRQFAGPARRYADDVLAAIAEVHPDLVVCSTMAPGAMVAAEAAGLPFDVLLPNVYLLPVAGRTPAGMGLRPASNRFARVRDRALVEATVRMWNRGLPLLNEVRAEHGLPALRRFFDQLSSARRQLVMTSEAFDLPGPLPANARYVGAVLDDPVWADTPWDPPPGDEPLVLVGLSSTFQDHVGCLQRIVDALGALPVRGLVTTGPAVDPSAITAPGDVRVVAAAPHSQVLSEAAAVVTHGGHGTVVRALAAGVPLVVLPHGRDQADNAVRLARRGAGVAVKRTASPTRIAAAVRQVLDDPSFGVQAAALGETIRRDADSDTLIIELEDLATSSRS